MKDLDTSDLAQLREAFDTCDKDGDGWIASGEFWELLQSLDHDLTQDESLLAFDMTDTDGDGAISFEEFMAWWTGD
ncbi:MAG TPA: EF-hand domain-containing protein [Steroidobacteraceae bacterium]